MVTFNAKFPGVQGLKEQGLLAALADPESAIYQAVAAIGGGGVGGPWFRYDYRDASSVVPVTSAPAAATANHVHFMPVAFYRTSVIDRLSVQITTGGAGNCHVAIFPSKPYNPAAAFDTGMPDTDNLIWQSGEDATDSTGYKHFSIADPYLELEPGLYYIATQFSGTPSVPKLTALSGEFYSSPPGGLSNGVGITSGVSSYNADFSAIFFSTPTIQAEVVRAWARTRAYP